MGSISALEKELRRRLEGEVRFDPGSRALYSTDASNYRQLPIGVVVPRHQGDVIEAVALARENQVPILARGGATSLAGQACNAALVVDFSKYLNRVRRVDAERRLAVVEPGLVLSRLNAALAGHGLFFAPDPTTKDRCNIGGMIGNNSCGAHSVAYGKTVDNLAGLEVLLYDGTKLSLYGGEPPAGVEPGSRVAGLFSSLKSIAERWGDLIRGRYPKIPRRVSGYNLDQLLPENGFNVARAMVGSEGTLGITLEATLQLVALPVRRALVVMGFGDVFAAADQAPWILEHRPQALEGFDDRLVHFVKVTGLHSELLHLLPEGSGFLLVEFGAASDAEVRDRAEALMAQARRLGACIGARVYTGEREQRQVWSLRESGLGASVAIAGYPRTWPGAEDAAVAPQRLGEYLRRFAAILARHEIEAASYYGHFGDGCVHARVSFDLFSAEGVRRFRRSMEEIADLVVDCGGSLSGEHGDGLARSELLARMFGAELMEAFAEFKRAFDPEGRMNPGVLVNPHPLDSHLRLGPGYHPSSPATHFDFSADGGFAGAALRCVGLGKCRKLDAGTMCPSYMATMEEEHSTRGRARLLFEALGGALAGGMEEPAVRQALELCLSCKACKRECPAGVDMATYKAEFLAHFYLRNRRPLPAWFFGRIHDFSRLGAVAPGAANALAHAPVLSHAFKWLLGVHPQRELPRLARRSFRSWFRRRERMRRDGPEVLLFPDTFNNLFEPEVAAAATEVLERAGFRVLIPPADACCGRPLYDQGMLGHARRRLGGLLEVLAPFAERGVPIVGLEPSCLLTFRDELPGLFAGDPRARALAQGSWLLDEFLARQTPGFVPPAIKRRALLHGHCHQKALAGLSGATTLLGRIPGLALTELDAGCCGMAGAFGYGVDRFEISRKIAERVLLPAIRTSAPDTLIIADGFSCRAQIAQLCPGRKALHLAQVLNLRPAI